MTQARVMIVEDDRIVAKDLQNSLESFGFDVSSIASSGTEALVRAKEDRPDLVLMDIILKGEIDGIEAADQIRSRFNIPVVYLTAYSDEKVLERAKVTEPFGYIIKPFEDRELFSAIEIALYKHKAEEALRESEEKFRSITVCAQDTIIMMDHEGNISYSNEAMENIFGYSSEEILGKELHALFVPERYQQAFSEGLEVFKLSGKGGAISKLVELNALRKDGTEFPIELSLSSVRVKGKWHALGIIRDISERKSAEKDKERLQDQLLQSQKMESIGTLASGIAHDFNNILGIIIGNADLAMDDVPEKNPARNNLKEIRKASHRAKDLVRQILAFSRQSHMELKPVRIGPIIKESLKMLRSSIPANIEIQQNLSSKWDIVLGDATQINQIFFNLCTNAAHALRGGEGVLEVSLEDVEFKEDVTAKYHDLTPGRYVKMTVRDTGQGIAPEDMERIFDPYFTTKEVGEGTGLGLSVTLGIVKNHGGAVSVKSELGKGTSFYVFLPSIEGEVKTEIETVEPLPGGNERILFVDDEKAMVDVVRPMLERMGYDVTARTGSVEALEAFQAKSDGFDLVITDLAMPNMTGLDLSRELIKIRPEIPIILCTGFSEKINAVKAEQTGVRATVMKPIVMSEIASTIRDVLDTT